MTHGPKHTVKYNCEGCENLRTKDWSFWGENDEDDSGTSATCAAKDKNISSYWYEKFPTPNWCPYLGEVNNDA